MQSQIDNIEKSVQEIRKALLGDEFNPDAGIIKRVTKNEEYVKKDKKFKWTVAGFLAALALFKDKIIAMF